MVQSFTLVKDHPVAPLRLLTKGARIPEVPPLPKRAHEEQVPAQAQGQVSKERSEWMNQREREVRFLWSVANDHAASVSGGTLTTDKILI